MAVQKAINLVVHEFSHAAGIGCYHRNSCLLSFVDYQRCVLQPDGWDDDCIHVVEDVRDDSLVRVFSLGLSRNPEAQAKRWGKGMAQRRKAAFSDPVKAAAWRSALKAGQQARWAKLTDADRAKLRQNRKAAYERWKAKRDQERGS